MTAQSAGTDLLIKPCAGHPDCLDVGRRIRGMCANHYQQWYKAPGNTEVRRYSTLKDPIAKLHAQSIVDERGCWVYQMSLDTHGYGRIWHGGHSWQAHRFAYLRLGQPFPEDFDLDHLCDNPPCWNPDHMDPVPDRINLARGSGMVGAWAHLHATCVCSNRWAESCPDHGQLHWRPDWRERLEAIYGLIPAPLVMTAPMGYRPQKSSEGEL